MANWAGTFVIDLLLVNAFDGKLLTGLLVYTELHHSKIAPATQE
jgi:hypothetical protein